MRKYLYITIFIATISFLLTACKNKKLPSVIQDIEIYLPVKFTKENMDSTYIMAQIAADTAISAYSENILDFYRRRHYQYAWIVDKNLSESAYTFYTILNNYITEFNDSSVFDPALKTVFDSIATDSLYITHIDLPKIEWLLTSSYFKYSTKAYYGTNKDLKDLEWFIPRNKKDYTILLDKIVKSEQDYQQYEPVNEYYKRLKKVMISYNEIKKEGGFPKIQYDSTQCTVGQHGRNIQQLKKYLLLTGDYADKLDSTDIYNDSLSQAVRTYQYRMGLTESGILNKTTVDDMNISIEARLKKIMINLERQRWLPDTSPQNYIFVNIPAYKLHVVENGKYVWSMKVVVGREATATSIFMGDISEIAMSPYWYVPQSIIMKEIVPACRRNPGYLARKNMEVVSGSRVLNPYSINWSAYKKGLPYSIRQKPGKNNSLGKVKFLFPNNFSIYLHDTPAKSLFNESNRAFSHGCIRLDEPQKLAVYLLRNDTSWTEPKIEAAMNSDTETKVQLQPTMPVVIAYLTAWADSHGRVHFRNDIYGHDEKLWKEVFGK